MEEQLDTIPQLGSTREKVYADAQLDGPIILPKEGLYKKEFEQILSHLNAAMDILNNVDENDYESLMNAAGEKKNKMYDALETTAHDVKSFINGDFITQHLPKMYTEN